MPRADIMSGTRECDLSRPCQPPVITRRPTWASLPVPSRAVVEHPEAVDGAACTINGGRSGETHYDWSVWTGLRHSNAIGQKLMFVGQMNVGRGLMPVANMDTANSVSMGLVFSPIDGDTNSEFSAVSLFQMVYSSVIIVTSLRAKMILIGSWALKLIMRMIEMTRDVSNVARGMRSRSYQRLRSLKFVHCLLEVKGTKASHLSMVYRVLKFIELSVHEVGNTFREMAVT